MKLIAAHVELLYLSKVFIEHHLLDKADVLDLHVLRIYGVLTPQWRRLDHVTGDESVDLSVLVEFQLHLLLDVATDFVATYIDFLNVLVSLQSMHKLCHLIVGYIVIT